MKRLLLTSVFLLVIFSAPALSAEFVVLFSFGGANYRVGEVFSDVDTLLIPDGAELIIISSLGKKIKLGGPFSGVLAKAPNFDEEEGGEEGSSLVRTFSKLIRSNLSEFGVIAAYRSVGESGADAKNFDHWIVDISKGGDVCFKSGEPLRISRPKGFARKDLIVTMRGKEASVVLKIPRERSSVIWPADAPVTNGGSYQFGVNGEGASIIYLHSIPDVLSNKLQIAAWMTRQGCDLQAISLVASVGLDKNFSGNAQPGKF